MTYPSFKPSNEHKQKVTMSSCSLIFWAKIYLKITFYQWPTCGPVGMHVGCMYGWFVASAEMHTDSRGRPRYQWCRRPNETGNLTKEEKKKKSFKRLTIWIQTCSNYHVCFSEILTWSTLSAAGRPRSKAPVVALSGASIREVIFILHSLVWLLADQLRGKRRED